MDLVRNTNQFYQGQTSHSNRSETFHLLGITDVQNHIQFFPPASRRITRQRILPECFRYFRTNLSLYVSLPLSLSTSCSLSLYPSSTTLKRLPNIQPYIRDYNNYGAPAVWKNNNWRDPTITAGTRKLRIIYYNVSYVRGRWRDGGNMEFRCRYSGFLRIYSEQPVGCDTNTAVSTTPTPVFDDKQFVHEITITKQLEHL